MTNWNSKFCLIQEDGSGGVSGSVPEDDPSMNNPDADDPDIVNESESSDEEEEEEQE